MNCKNSIIKLLGSAFMLGVVMTSCYDYAEVPLVELAALESEIIVEADGGIFELSFYTNSAYHIEYLDEVDWLTLTADEPVNEMSVLTGECTQNNGFKRRVDFVLCSDLDTRRDTVTVKQEAYADAFLDFGESSVVLPGVGGTTEYTIHTNVPFDEMSVGITYSDPDNIDWVTGFEVIDSDSDDRTLMIVTDPNADEEAPRVATATLAFTDGWGDRVSASFILLQCNANEEAGREISFEDFRNEYSEGNIIYDYVQISGIVVSNTANGNAGEPDQKTTSTIDFTPTATTVYLESEDGRYGINIQTATEDDNIFEQFDHVTILLHGTVGTLLEENPACYQITGVDKSMVLSRVSGTVDDVPVKERTIGNLTDDDIYTYVKLTNVELPVRKGPIFPANGAYFSCVGRECITKWPLLVRDINGDDMFLLTNDKCSFHRDGTRLPYGSGSLYGVVAHEHFSRYEWREGADPADIYDDETLGNIGRYSLRPQTKDDVWRDMNDDFEDGFSALLCEYRYRVIKEQLDVPSYGTNGWLTHTYQTAYTNSSSKNYTGGTGTHFSGGGTTFDYLGPVGNSTARPYGINYGNENGIGVIIDPDHEDMTYLPTRFAVNDDGKYELACPYAESEYCGYGSSGFNEADRTVFNDKYPNVPNNCPTSGNAGRGFIQAGAYLDYVNNYWWDDDYDKPYGYLLYVSTEGISSSVVSLQFCMRATAIFYTPRFWTVEWSSVNNQNDESNWSYVGEFTLPDASDTSSPTIWQLPGFKPFNFTLPNSILGLKDVYIRIRPTNDLCGSGGDYANARLKDCSSGKAESQDHGVSISYLAIRYNK